MDGDSRLPPSACINPKVTTDASWIVHGRLFPYLEQNSLANQIDLSLNWSNFPVINGYRVPTYVCSLDPKSNTPHDTSATGSAVQFFLYPTNYASNVGTWFVYDPATKSRRGWRNASKSNHNTIKTQPTKVKVVGSFHVPSTWNHGKSLTAKGTAEVPAPFVGCVNERVLPADS
jgi:hypothetical protein